MSNRSTPNDANANGEVNNGRLEDDEMEKAASSFNVNRINKQISPNVQRRVRHRHVVDNHHGSTTPIGKSMKDVEDSSTKLARKRTQPDKVMDVDQGDVAEVEYLSSGGGNSSRNNSFRRKKKSNLKNRKLQREQKHRLSGELAVPGGPGDYFSLSLPSPGHFYRSLAFDSQPSSLVECEPPDRVEDGSVTGDDELASGNTTDLSTPRRISTDDSLEERKDFHAMFSALIRMGDNVNKHADLESTDLQRTSFSSDTGTRSRPLRRSDCSSVGPQQTVSFGNYLWLHLQAWSSGKSIKPKDIKMSLDLMDEELIDKRVKKSTVLNDLRNFTFEPENKRKLSDAAQFTQVRSPAAGDDGKLSVNSHLFFTKPEIFNFQFVELQNEAVWSVCDLLTRYEELQSLFPNRKTFLMNSQVSPELDERLLVLQIWYNITRDLCRKIKTIGLLLEMHKAKDGVEWPNMEYESPSVSRANTPMDEKEVVAGLTSPSTSYNQIHHSHSDLEFVTTATMYKQFVEKSLKLRGMRKALARIGDIVGPTLCRAKQALQKNPQHVAVPTVLTPDQSMNSAKLVCAASRSTKSKRPDEKQRRHSRGELSWAMQSTGKFGGLLPTPRTFFSQQSSASSAKPPGMMTRSASSNSTLVEENKLMRQWSDEYDPDLLDYGSYNASFKATKLPSFYPSFIFLLRVPLSLVHEWLKIRIEQQSINPDPVTLDQLIQDCQDCLAAAVEVKCFYQELVQATTDNEEQLKKLLIDDISDFETDLQKMFAIYLCYIQKWASHQSTLNHMSSETNQSLIHRLEEEWKFAKKTAINVSCGESDAAKQFCKMNNEMYDNINELLFDLKLKMNKDDDEEKSESGCNSEPSSFVAYLPPSRRSSAFECCRTIRTYLHEIRERSLRALTFSKLLRNDLEISSKYELKCVESELLTKLQLSNFYRVKTVNFSPEFLMFCEKSIIECDEFLQLLLNVTCGRDEREIPAYIAQMKGYLLLIKCGETGCHRLSKHWNGQTVEVTPDADTNLALHNLEVDGVYLVVSSSDKLRDQRNQLKKVVADEFIQLVDEQCSCHMMIAQDMQSMKHCALNLRNQIAEWLAEVQENFFSTTSEFDDNEKQTYRDAFIQAYNFAFEYHKELAKLVTGATKNDLVDNIRQFAHQWCSFVQEICVPGHGLRPRWASEGLNFLVFAAEPAFTQNYTDFMFAELKKSYTACVEHVIGDKGNQIPARISADPVHRAVSWPQSAKTEMENNQDQKLSSTLSPRSFVPDHPYNVYGGTRPKSTGVVPVELPNFLENGVENAEKSKEGVQQVRQMRKQMLERLAALEAEREAKLVDSRRIGRCLERQDVRPHYQIAFKRANFKWQRLNKKIGAGKFGSVFTAINLDAGQLMAMKQIKFQQQDHQAMQSLVDEVTNFEGIQHENLVRYFGVEVHRDELFIFMEYCNEGTLEQLCRDGITEDGVRMYTLQLLNGVCDLHRRGIVHRDIKTANVFLKNEYQTLKLGDFGSSVRLKETTTVVGELTTYVGTPAYMAPEVCTSSQEGYGRAADIWSVGCVVLEMSTGKPPWHDMNNTYQIIWKVGNGLTPHVPDTLNEDCKSFLKHCFQSKDKLRWSGERLMEHPFVKVSN